MLEALLSFVVGPSELTNPSDVAIDQRLQELDEVADLRLRYLLIAVQ